MLETGAKLFQGKAQVDVVTVLMLLGEAAIWKVIWGRFRSRRMHWKHWVFAISPGWTTLAASLFAAVNGSLHAPNLIFDRVPENTLDRGLILTNLESGASHTASNVIVQNIWQTWNGGPRAQHRRREPFDVTKEIGLVDVNLDKLHLEHAGSWWFQLVCLVTQIVGTSVLGIVKRNFEPFVVLVIALLGQCLLLASIVPRPEAWFMTPRGKRPCPILLHKGFDSVGVLFIRRVQLNGREISLEEFCWDPQVPRSQADNIKLSIAGFAFSIFVMQIILVGFMDSSARIIYLAFGGLGVLANTIEAASSFKWSSTFASAFSGKATCAPKKSSLMAAVAVLLAGRFPAATPVAKLLYPDNQRFAESLRDLTQLLDDRLCEDCRKIIRYSHPFSGSHMHRCLWRLRGERVCQDRLARSMDQVNSKQLRDGLATVCHYLRFVSLQASLPPIETASVQQISTLHTW
ncbi:MAG: hypothetical protein Q9195_000232 [Heterodermia aff. obscurata]